MSSRPQPAATPERVNCQKGLIADCQGRSESVIYRVLSMIIRSITTSARAWNDKDATD